MRDDVPHPPPPPIATIDAAAAALAAGGFVAAEHEAALLAAAAGGAARLAALVARRLQGEPLAWITGRVRFDGLDLVVRPGVYVPRPHSEALARRAAELLPAHGTAVDVCTGCGALAAVVQHRRPAAKVVGIDSSAAAVACADANGVRALQGDLLAPLLSGSGTAAWRGAVDVLAGVVPYVPTGMLPFLQRDTFTFERREPYDGGLDGTQLLRRVVGDAPALLRPGGRLLLELGGEQFELLTPALADAGFVAAEALLDEDGDVRGVQATFQP